VRPLSFPGSYADRDGTDEIEWRIVSDRPHSPIPDFLVHTEIRGVAFSEIDFDGLEPLNLEGTAPFPVDHNGFLTDCDLSGEFPCTIEREGQKQNCVLSFRLRLRSTSGSPGTARDRTQSLRVAVTVDETTYEADGWDFEEVVLKLDKMLPDGARLICCLTCLFSDYSPYGGHGVLTHMACYRSAKAQYLAFPRRFDAKGKLEFARIPVAEYVPEPYLCNEYQHRVAGTGYRG
jgi:hypothetical protein